MATASLTGFAQAESKDWLLGGNARFWQYNKSGESLYQMSLALDGGYFWHKNFVSGLRPTVSWTYSNRDFNGVIFTRYYYHFKTVSPYAEINAGYGLLNFYSAISQKLFSKTESTIMGGRVGAAFWITPKVSFDAFLYGSYLNSTIHNLVGSMPQSYKSDESINGLGIGFFILL